MGIIKGRDTTIRIGDGPEMKLVEGFLVPEGFPAELLRPPSLFLMGYDCKADLLPEPDPENFWSFNP